jgi:hypothetical protein
MEDPMGLMSSRLDDAFGVDKGHAHHFVAQLRIKELKMNSLQTFDLSPFARSVIGIDKIERLFNSAMEGVGNDGYPPFNITKEGEM